MTKYHGNLFVYDDDDDDDDDDDVVPGMRPAAAGVSVLVC